MIYRKLSGALVSRGGVSAEVHGSHSQCNAVQKNITGCPKNSTRAAVDTVGRMPTLHGYGGPQAVSRS